MVEIKELFESLHPLERKVLPILDNSHELADITQKSSLQEVEVMRALQWLFNKKAVVIKEELKEVVVLQSNGKEYQTKGLPERRFIDALGEKELSVQEIEKLTELSKEEINITLGVLRTKASIEIKKVGELLKVKLTEQGKQWLKKDFPEEKFLEQDFPLDIKSLSPEQKLALENLKKRKQILSLEIKKSREAKLTDLGKELLNYSKKSSEKGIMEKITPELMRSGEWKNKTFRRFDVSTNVPKEYGGKLQHYRKFLDEVRQKFMSLG
ncbi:MAG: hypothetical protein AABX39_06450, partial [Nanoarchaeota archaeon]